MAILAEFDWGWVLDHRKSIDNDYTCVSSSSNLNLSHENSIDGVQYYCNSDMFNIYEPFAMDSQYNAKRLKNSAKDALKNSATVVCADDQSVTNLNTDDEGSRTRLRKKRKRKIEYSEGEKLHIDRHLKIKRYLQEALDSLKKNNVFLCNEIPATTAKDNNLSSRKIAKLQFTLQSLGGLLETLNHENSDEKHKQNSQYFNRLVSNEEGRAKVVSMFEGHWYLIPADSRFLMSDVSRINLLVSEGSLYDLVVIDPPWKNKSVKRKKTYSTLSDNDLINLPVAQLCRPGALVVVWATNKMSQQNLITQQLFPAWNVELLGQWYWLKITLKGEPVCDLDSDDLSKKPYETIFIGRYTSFNESSSSYNKKTCTDLSDPDRSWNINSLNKTATTKLQESSCANMNGATRPTSGATVGNTRNGRSSKETTCDYTDDILLNTSDAVLNNDREKLQSSSNDNTNHQLDDTELPNVSDIISHKISDSVKNNDEQMLQSSLNADSNQHSDEELRNNHSVPDRMIIVSVPCSSHSRKPPLNEILMKYVRKESPMCLEMFARNLLPHWTSWGNEVLTFQHEAFFTTLPHHEEVKVKPS